MKKSWLWFTIAGFAAVVLLGTIVGMIGCTNNVETNIENVNLPVPPEGGEETGGGSHDEFATTTTTNAPVPPGSGEEGERVDEFPDTTSTTTTTTTTTSTTTSTMPRTANNDTIDDVIVLATMPTGTVKRAHLFFGGAFEASITSAAADHTFLTSDIAANDFTSVSRTGGDVNGDGYSDFVVGAGLVEDLVGNTVGQVYIFYGGPDMDDNPDVVLTGSIHPEGVGNYYFGSSVSIAGDLNGDGYDDVVVGAMGFEGGHVFVYYGGDSMDNLADINIDEAEDGDSNFGVSVSGAGDVNGDGYDDVIVGAGQANLPGLPVAGRAYIYFGGPSMDGDPDVQLLGQQDHEYFGTSVSAAGDVNNDGYADVVVGAPYAKDDGSYKVGKAYLYLGGFSMNADPDVIFVGERRAGSLVANDQGKFGIAVAALGDVNNDNYDDVAVGAQDSAGVDNSSGKAYVYYGGETMNNGADINLLGVETNDEFGWAVATPGDVNDDGINDIIVGAYGSDPNGSGSGSAHIFYGAVASDGSPVTKRADEANVILSGTAAGNYFGYSVGGTYRLR